MSWRRRSGRWSASSGRRWATSCARCTRSTASSSISRTRRSRSTAEQVTLKSGGTLEADLVVCGVGVRPRTGAGREGRARDRPRRRRQRVSGDERAGNLRGRRHRALARSAYRPERSASSTGWSPSARARPRRCNMLGHARGVRRRAVLLEPALRRADQLCRPRRGWDEIAIEGDIAGKDCLVRYKRKGRTLAVASIYRDVESLQAEVAMERERA